MNEAFKEGSIHMDPHSGNKQQKYTRVFASLEKVALVHSDSHTIAKNFIKAGYG